MFQRRMFRQCLVIVAFVLAGLMHPVFAAGMAPLGCPRPLAGAVAREPVNLFSHAGVLNVSLTYATSLDADNRTLFCFVTPNGDEAPTLHVRPGDTLKITLRNRLPALPASAVRQTMLLSPDACGSRAMDATSVNMHFHGSNTSPACHADDAINTLVNAGQDFTYSLTFPRNEPAGLYWYHPHVHTMAENAVLGGATGVIVVEGMENVQPIVAGLPSRVLIMRDQVVAGNPNPGGKIPAWDVSLNYVPISYPALTPAVIRMSPTHQELWRFANSSADTVADIQLRYDDVPQPLLVVARDGVATGSQDGTRQGKPVTMTDILLPPGGRAEFVVTAPGPNVQLAELKTLRIATGPDGDNDTERTLAILQPGGDATDTPQIMAAASAMPAPQRFEGLDAAPVTAYRTVYFSEVLSDPSNAASPTNFYITVAGTKPKLFSPTNPPAITTTQGSVEQWTIENRAKEVHEFHIHQVHFKLLARNGEAVPLQEQQFLDSIQVPYWSGKGPYPSVTLKLDFRGDITGDFVYHCHILGHEDSGMMAILRILPRHATTG